MNADVAAPRRSPLHKGTWRNTRALGLDPRRSWRTGLPSGSTAEAHGAVEAGHFSPGTLQFALRKAMAPRTGSTFDQKLATPFPAAGVRILNTFSLRGNEPASIPDMPPAHFLPDCTGPIVELGSIFALTLREIAGFVLSKAAAAIRDGCARRMTHSERSLVRCVSSRPPSWRALAFGGFNRGGALLELLQPLFHSVNTGHRFDRL